MENCGFIDFINIDNLGIADFPERVTFSQLADSILIAGIPRTYKNAPDHPKILFQFNKGTGFKKCN